MPKRTKTSHPRIFAYKDGTYYYRAGDDEFSLETKDWNEALEKAQIEDYKRDKRFHGKRKLTVSHVLDDYLAERKLQINNKDSRRRGIRPVTYKEIEDLFKLHLTPYFGTKKLFDLDEDLWDAFCSHCSVGDMTNLRKVFGKFLKWCKRRKYILYVPDLDIPQVRRRKRRVLKPDEIMAMFNHAKGDILLFISMGIFMGMRPGEIRLLTWDRVDLDHGTLVLTEFDTKTNKGRHIPLNSFVWQALRMRKRYGPYVFCNPETPIKPFYKQWPKGSWATLMTDAKIKGKCTPNDMRSTYEKYSNKRSDFTDTQREKFSGASIEVQKRIYAHMDADDLRGLEEVVQVDGLAELLSAKLLTTGIQRGAKSESTTNA